MEIMLTLALPRDQLSVPVVRSILRHSLLTLGTTEDCVSDIGIALTEACTNVLDHARGSSEYEVAAGIDGSTCVIQVIDRGAGFDGDPVERGDAAEDGRGLLLMRALVDKVTFTNRPTEGTVVHLEKQLTFEPGAVATQLDQRPLAGGPWSDPK